VNAEPETTKSSTKSLGRARMPVSIAVFVGAAAAGLAVVYGIGALKRNAGDPQCAPAVETGARVAPFAHGEVAALAVAEAPLQIPDVAFQDAGGAERHLTEWRGRTVLLNLWATWCIPCRKEMPALDALQGKLGGPRFEVVAVNIDTRASARPQAWLQEIGVKALSYYGDPSARVFQDLKQIGRALGLPTTLIVDPAGCEIGTAAGPAEWASPDGLKLISAALGS